MNAIEIENLSKTFKGKKGGRVDALKSLSLTVEAGEVFGFLGPNGAGKSTTIKTLTGLISPTSGTVRIMGVDARSHLSRKHIGYLPENPSFYDYLSAEEYLSFVGASVSMSEAVIAKESKKVLQLLGLWDVRKRPIRSFSKGMVQRLGLAQVLLRNPDIYILDEPMSGLDPIGRALVKDIILDLKKEGKCVFFSTHITADVETICDRVGIIVQGALQKVDDVQSILTEGITGYAVRFRTKDGGASCNEVLVATEELTRFLTDAQSKGDDVILVEPRRKNLEEFFLAMVKGKGC
jgi:ABC-2 type transport system ATP-binding protein